MNELLLNFFKNNVNNEKLKKSRLTRNLTLSEVSDKTGIPFTTLKRYEDGDTKKIPVEALKKICQVYGTDYQCYYAWTSFPFFGTLGGILISLFFGISINSMHTGGVIGGILGILGLRGLNSIVEKKENEEKDLKKIVYDSLNDEEKKEYDDFLLISKTVLKTDNFLEEEDKKDMDKFLFATFMIHQIRKKNKKKIIDFEEAETLIVDDNN